MTSDQWITIAIIIIAIVLFIFEWITVDLVGLVIISLLIVTGILSPIDAVKGFSNSATITIAAMFVLSGAIIKTGQLNTIGNYLSKILVRNKIMGILVLMLLAGGFSAFINNTPVVAVFIPIVLDASSRANISASKILIPLSFASMFGGLCTLIGTSGNILISSIARDEGLEPFGIFEMAPVGVVLFAVGIIYLLLTGNKLIPDRGKRATLSEKYDMGSYVTDIRLLHDSPSVGKAIHDSPLYKELEIEIIGFGRGSEKIVEPVFSTLLTEGDILRVSGDLGEIKKIQARQGIEILKENQWKESMPDADNLMLAEAIITPGSELEGKTMSQTRFKNRYGAFALAIRSRNQLLRNIIRKTSLRAGDILLLSAKKEKIDQFKEKQNNEESPFLIISEIEKHPTSNKKMSFLVFSIIAGVVIVASFNILPIVASALVGVTLLVLFRLLDMQEVYKAINWQVIFLIAGTIGLGVALEKTGTANVLAERLIYYIGDFGPVALVIVLYLITSLLTELISNAASAVLLAPIAISAATAMGIDPRPLLIVIMFAASASFMTPVGYQTNTMIYTAGNYKFSDFFRVGAPLNLLFWILTSILVPLYYKLI